MLSDSIIHKAKRTEIQNPTKNFGRGQPPPLRHFYFRSRFTGVNTVYKDEPNFNKITLFMS